MDKRFAQAWKVPGWSLFQATGLWQGRVLPAAPFLRRLSTSLWSCVLPQISELSGHDSLFFRYGKGENSPAQIHYYSKIRVIRCCCSIQAGQDDSKRNRPPIARLRVLDGQHLCDTLHKEQRQTFPHVCCKQNRSNT